MGNSQSEYQYNQQIHMVRDLDPKRYSGVWYEIAKKDLFWERGCDGAKAIYGWDEQKQILNVENQCLDENKNIIRKSYAEAWIPNPEQKGWLKIQFQGMPFTGDYIVHWTDYQLAIVGSPDRKYLWVLYREPQIPSDLIAWTSQKISNLGYNPDKVIVNRGVVNNFDY